MRPLIEQGIGLMKAAVAVAGEEEEHNGELPTSQEQEVVRNVFVMAGITG